MLPLSIYLPLMFLLTTIVFAFNLSGAETGLQYYNMLSSMPMYWPAALNPIITIVVIRPYRQAFFSTVLGCWLCNGDRNAIITESTFGNEGTTNIRLNSNVGLSRKEKSAITTISQPVQAWQK